MSEILRQQLAQILAELRNAFSLISASRALA